MSQYSQEERVATIETPLGKDVLLLSAFRGEEAMSRLFRFEAELFSENHSIPFTDIIGKNVTIAFTLAEGSQRFFNGIVGEFAQGRGGGAGTSESSDTRVAFYTATLVPWPWLLSRTADSRIFQELSVPDIISQIFGEAGFSDYEFRLRGSYEPRTYCVQYRETDFNFISRLLESEGIFYFFAHEKGKHVLVMADNPDENPPCPGQDKVRYQTTGGGWMEEDVIQGLSVRQLIQPGKVSLNDYNFEVPTTPLQVGTAARESPGPGEREIYDYPGGYGKVGEGERLSAIQMEAEEARVLEISGTSDARSLVGGHRFTLSGFYRSDLNKALLLTRVVHELVPTGDTPVTRGTGDDMSYSNRFDCMPHDVPFRPLRQTRKPTIRGSQTAIVTGPAGEEIHTDEHGRVKVQFHWDREGQRDENSSCWIRVSQGWAGASWGAMYIPRIGHEVIVDFLEGDPDRPIVTGRVYHGQNQPPYPLPGEKTKSTLKSNSSLGGGGYNEFRFEDKKGEEEIYLHGQKDWSIVIENDKNQTVGRDETLFVGNDRTKSVGNDQSETIGVNKTIGVGGNHSETIGAAKTLAVGASHTETVGANMNLSVGANRLVTIGANKTETIGVASALTIGAAYQISVGAALNQTVGGIKSEQVAAAKSVSVGANENTDVGGSRSVSVGGSQSVDVKKSSSHHAKSIVIEADDEITLKTGKASITLKKSGDIAIKGSKINIKGSGNITIKGKKILEN